MYDIYKIERMKNKDRIRNWSLWLENDTQEYYLQHFKTGKVIYLSKKQNKLIHKLKAKSWKYTLFSGKCDTKIENICEKIIGRKNEKNSFE